MKKFFYLPLAIAATLFAACGDTYTTTCDHDFAAIDTYYVPVNSWAEADGDGLYLYYTYALPAITEYVIDQGIVLSYLLEGGRDNLLPYLRPWGINGYDEPYSQNIRYDIEPGYITFIIEASDLDMANLPATPLEFKVSILQNWTH